MMFKHLGARLALTIVIIVAVVAFLTMVWPAEDPEPPVAPQQEGGNLR